MRAEELAIPPHWLQYSGEQALYLTWKHSRALLSDKGAGELPQAHGSRRAGLPLAGAAMGKLVVAVFESPLVVLACKRIGGLVQSFELAHHNIYHIYGLLECMNGPVL